MTNELSICSLCQICVLLHLLTVFLMLDSIITKYEMRYETQMLKDFLGRRMIFLEDTNWNDSCSSV